MKQRSLLFILLLCSFGVFAQTTADYAIQLSAVVQTTPPQIRLTWRPLTDTPTYAIYRKAKAANSWGTAIASLPASDSFYIDANVVTDSAYEYQVLAQGTNIQATGYIYAGIMNPPMHNKGALLLLVDSTFSDSCSARIYRLMKDISGDGWKIIRHDLSRTITDTAIHTLISNDYTNNPDLASILILGHLAVPYSGDLNPDGHPEHLGAWPADVYYANIVGPWTDNIVNDVSGGYTPNHNIPGDGKWDQTTSPLPIPLEISRVDFYNMPAFSRTEVQLMNSYLDKDHIYKMDSMTMRHRALISDNFGVFSGEAFAANGWRNFPPLLTRDSIQSIPFIASLNDSAYQWAYGCGGGSFTSAGGIGTTSDFATSNMNVIFTMLFGSYFGDWNVQNDFMRAPLCSDVPALTSCWAGRPNWFLHHMALGENIGYATRLTQNNSFLYSPQNYGANFVHIALMGDLTLRTDYIKPPLNLTITPTFHAGANLSWGPSPAPNVAGYFVYRSDSLFGFYKKISVMLTGTSFHDSTGTDGLKYYMIRPAKLQSTPSGSYYNLGVGITDSATVSYPLLQVASTNSIERIDLYPVPVKDNLNIAIKNNRNNETYISIINENGEQLLSAKRQLRAGDNLIKLDVGMLPAGFYELVTRTGGYTISKKWIKVQ